ncbi:tetratricopeptide repeat protein [Halomonas sp.]|uniref:O-linked N-acetylglucosamine transferase, SPINDLY family protein n=1 Tax=Halomonas sp. TaxID=1486246 RepID=UPI00384FA3EE
MTKIHARRRSSPRTHQAGTSVPAAKLGAFDAAFQAGDYAQALALAEAMVKCHSDAAEAHERHVNALGSLKCFREASEAMARVIRLAATPNAAQRTKLALYQIMAGQAKAAVPILETVLDEQPEHLLALVWLSRAHYQLGNGDRALAASNIAYALDSEHEEMLQWRAIILDRLARHDDAVKTLQRLIAINPKRQGANNSLATLYVKEGDYKRAEAHYAKEMELRQGKANGVAYSNLIIATHYNPDYSGSDIASKILEWEPRYAKRSPLGRAETSKDPKKRLRIGLLSGGFRLHPVGQMILPALQHMSAEQFELVAYSTSQAEDTLTHKFLQAVSCWEVVDGLDDSQLEQKIRADEVDILIDMNGGGDGSRYAALTREPAPLIVKWVGSLINTTGLNCFDYLLSDSIETPAGVDHLYTEKLVRLPDDYICYHIPDYAPSGGMLPALSNGYITFGCLNSPAKLSPPLLAEWAILLNEVPNSRLLLRGMQFDSARYRDKVAGIFAEHGIEADRLIMEKGAPHQEFLATYQRIDIALDTWPYSGGLTTCEALMMGVPVVTRVGPTFAGRHSATHLVNAGLSELVTGSWEEFRQRAKELANDLPNLAVIRAALRTILVDSPICNGPRFANHMTTALRAIWQRHCEGKAPEALTFNKSGAAQFADEDSPVKLALALPSDGFDWQLESPVLAVDNGAVLASRPDARELLGSGRVVMLSFDPGGKLETVDHLAQYGEIQHFPYTALGDGQPVTLYLGRDVKPATLPSLDGELAVEEHSIPSVSLDSIEGLPSIDLLALDASHDSLTILENGTQALQEALLIQASFSFQPTLQNQPDFAKLKALMARHEFRFYCFKDMAYQSHLPESVPPGNFQATELASADALFIPSAVRMTKLSDAQRIKLAFLLHTIFGIKDMAHEILTDVNEEIAQRYLIEQGLIERKQEPESQLESPVIGNLEMQKENNTQLFPLPEAPHMSAAERYLFKKNLKQANRYFEFGSGGSTVWAVQEGLTVQGVESDENWVNALKDKLGEKCQVEAVDIGKTKEWGFPISTQASDNFPTYSQAIAKHENPFDFILVDGRFRVACTTAAILHILDHSDKPKNTRIFIHDFWNRPHYHIVLQFLETVEKAETAGIFKVSENVNRADVASIWLQYAKQSE